MWVQRYVRQVRERTSTRPSCASWPAMHCPRLDRRLAMKHIAEAAGLAARLVRAATAQIRALRPWPMPADGTCAAAADHRQREAEPEFGHREDVCACRCFDAGR